MRSGEVLPVRALAVCLVLLASAAPATAAPLHIRPPDSDFVRNDEPRLRLPGEQDYQNLAASQNGSSPVFGPSDARFTTTSKPSGFSVGLIHAESETINGRSHVHYRLEGMHVMGGDISGSVSGHGAMLSLRWPPSGD